MDQLERVEKWTSWRELRNGPASAKGAVENFEA
jgi:hypothetical protein